MDDGVARTGEVVFSSPGLPVLKALGLGSCIGLCIFDPVLKLGCMAHIMLPDSGAKTTSDLGKYADTAVPYVINQMIARGAQKYRLRAAIAGGAQLFNLNGATDRFDIGKRNAEAVKGLMTKAGLRLIAEDIGGNCGRTVVFDVNKGDITVRLVGGVEKSLANLAK